MTKGSYAIVTRVSKKVNVGPVPDRSINSIYAFFITTIEHLVMKAAMAPTAANTGNSNAPTTPTVKGMTSTSSPFSLRMMICRAFPALMMSLTVRTKSSPVTLSSSLISSVGLSYDP